MSYLGSNSRSQALGAPEREPILRSLVNEVGSSTLEVAGSQRSPHSSQAGTIATSWEFTAASLGSPSTGRSSREEKPARQCFAMSYEG
jgi:hypothetical protein